MVSLSYIIHAQSSCTLNMAEDFEFITLKNKIQSISHHVLVRKLAYSKFTGNTLRNYFKA